MSRRTLVLRGLAIAGIALVLTGCRSGGDLSVRNESAQVVTVALGDDQSEVTAGGGVVFLGYGCTPGDVTVQYASGESVVVPGPVCPEQEIVVREGTVDLQPVSTSAP